MRVAIVVLLALSLAACGKLGFSGALSQSVGNWAQVRLPAGCVAKQIAADHETTAVLCEDGRVFH